MKNGYVYRSLHEKFTDTEKARGCANIPAFS
jgi:hypothetical protein